MSRREKQRANRMKGRLEAKLDTKNSFGHEDTTPLEAVNNIRNKQKAVS